MKYLIASLKEKKTELSITNGLSFCTVGLSYIVRTYTNVHI